MRKADTYRCARRNALRGWRDLETCEYRYRRAWNGETAYRIYAPPTRLNRSAKWPPAQTYAEAREIAAEVLVR